MLNRTSLSISHAALADAVLPAVLAAARVQMHHFRSGAAVTTKADASPVTAADQQSEALIVAALATIAPSVPIIAEEAAAAGQLPDLQAGALNEFFLVDPLDGTREFIADRPEFTINIALVRGGITRFGIIYAPALDVLYATLGEDYAVETTLQPSSTATRFADLTLRPMRTRLPPAAGLVAVASRSHGSFNTDAFLGQYRIQQRMTAGSSLKFGVIAKGEADIYPRLGPTCEWDTAAGHAILSAAGGSVTTLDGAPLRYGNTAAKYLNPDFVAWGRTLIPPEF
jgi:3'(2'), 5'-bisphosphate nucleotidase